jgi:hypothetical protein
MSKMVTVNRVFFNLDTGKNHFYGTVVEEDKANIKKFEPIEEKVNHYIDLQRD